jgi:hypothetical protein
MTETLPRGPFRVDVLEAADHFGWLRFFLVSTVRLQARKRRKGWDSARHSLG